MKNETNPNTYIEDNVTKLSDKRKFWEEGTYKKSNEDLFLLLGECLEFYTELKGDTKKIKALNDYLRPHSNSFSEGAGLETRIVRAVFGPSIKKRAYDYAKVIKIAAAEKKPDETMVDFITKRGGVEELRRTKKDGKSPSDLRHDNIAIAKKTLNATASIVEPFEVSASTHEINEGAEHSLFVAVIRVEKDGKYSLVYETSSVSLINAALEQVGKEQSKTSLLKDADTRREKNVCDSLQAVNEAVELASAA
jgi:hypothetical protein